MNMYDVKERLIAALKNETDGFLATVLEPNEAGLPMYFIFNCYGMARGFLLPKKHREMIVEIAKDDGSDKRCKRFDWKKMIPVVVSDSPKILLKGKKRERALSLFNKQEWEDAFSFMRQNKLTIQRHWKGEIDSLNLIRELKCVERGSQERF